MLTRHNAPNYISALKLVFYSSIEHIGDIVWVFLNLINGLEFEPYEYNYVIWYSFTILMVSPDPFGISLGLTRLKGGILVSITKCYNHK